MGKTPWIPCDEKMPEKDGKYLVWVKEFNGQGFAAVIETWNKTWKFYTKEVTHWARVTPPETITDKEA